MDTHRFWRMEGWDSTKKLFERISTDRIDENGTRKTLPVLAAKYGLSDREVIEFQRSSQRFTRSSKRAGEKNYT